MKIQLKELTGKEITVLNVAHEQMEDGKLQFCFNGTLEAKCDDDPNYYLRVKECYNGCSGISFNERHVLEIDKQPSGRINVTLRWFAACAAPGCA